MVTTLSSSDPHTSASFPKLAAVARVEAEEIAIDAQGVNYSFGSGDTRTQVLFENEFQIGRGEVVILTGPSGSGKTTLLTLIGTLRHMQEGYLNVMGHDMSMLEGGGQIALRRQMGFIFQHHNLFSSLTALQNVRMATILRPGSVAEMNERGSELLAELGLGERLNYLPSRLSGGQRQRVAIARALVNRPPLVLADEPTAALDAHSGEVVMQHFRRLAEGTEQTTILIVTHDQRVLNHAHRIINLVGGRIVSNVMPDRSIRICKLLRRIPAFQVFSAPTLTKFTDQMLTENYKVGDTVVEKGQAHGFFYLIGNGRLQVFRDNDPKGVLGPGEYFYGRTGTISSDVSPDTIRAITDAELYVLSQESFEEMIGSNREFSEQVRLHLMSRQ